MRAIISLLLLATVAACSNNDAQEQATRQRFIATMNSRVNLSDEQLVRSMGRAPDSAFQLNATTRLLRWKMEVPYTTRGRSPEYIAVGTSIVAVGGERPQQRMAYCNIEWRSKDGIADSYQYFGDGCP